MYETVCFYSQIPIQSTMPTPVVAAGAGAGIDAATTAWVAAVVANGGSVSGARQIVVNNLIVGLKADGVWTKLDRLWLHAAENEPSALTDIVATELATKFNSPAFTTDLGYTGNGSNAQVETAFDPSTAPSPKFALNSACHFAWNNTASGSTGTGQIIGTNDFNTNIWVSFTDGRTYYGVNAGLVNFADTTGATGLYLANRTVSTDVLLDLNGSQADTQGSNSSAVPNTVFRILGNTGFFTNRQCSAAGFGGGLSGGERINIYTRLRTYMTAVGVP